MSMLYREARRKVTPAWIYGFWAGYLAFAVVAVALALGGCARAGKLELWMREGDLQYDRAVEISALCAQDDGQTSSWTGSGVVVSPTKLLTAAHMVEHGSSETCAFVAEDSKGRRHLVRPTKVLDSEHVDLAAMELLSPTDKFSAPPVRFGPRPRVGDPVCQSTGHPRRERRCGRAMVSKDLPGDVRVDLVVEPGNSGSGLYDASGALVGIVVHLYQCGNGQYCTGAATSLEGRMGALL